MRSTADDVRIARMSIDYHGHVSQLSISLLSASSLDEPKEAVTHLDLLVETLRNSIFDPESSRTRKIRESREKGWIVVGEMEN